MKKNIPLILGLSLPLLMIIIIALFIYLPVLHYNPRYDFIYSLDRQYSSSNAYFIENAQIKKNPQFKTPFPALFRYDVKKNQSHVISFEEAQTFKLDPNPLSPDGYRLKNGNNVAGVIPFLLFVDNDAGVYLDSDQSNHRLNIGTYENGYWGLHFIGWLLP